MNVNSVGNTNAAAPNTALQAQNAAVQQTQFLELLVAQMQNQNPLEPMEGTEYMTQLAQFSSLEQLTQVNQGLGVIAEGQAGMISGQAVDLIGKDVTYSGNALVLGEDQSVDITYQLNSAAEDLTITVYDQNGVRMGTVPHGPRAAGMNRHTWDGTVVTANGDEQRVPAGTYTYELEATRTVDGREAPVTSITYGAARVTGVTYENGYPELMLGDTGRIVPGDVLKIAENN